MTFEQYKVRSAIEASQHEALIALQYAQHEPNNTLLDGIALGILARTHAIQAAHLAHEALGN